MRTPAQSADSPCPPPASEWPQGAVGPDLGPGCTGVGGRACDLLYSGSDRLRTAQHQGLTQRVCPKGSESAQAVTRSHGPGVSPTTGTVSPGPGGGESETRTRARPGLGQAGASWQSFSLLLSWRTLSGTSFLSARIPPPGGLATGHLPNASHGAAGRQHIHLGTNHSDHSRERPPGPTPSTGPAICAATNSYWSGKGLVLCSRPSPGEERPKPTSRKSAPRGKVGAEGRWQGVSLKETH